MCAESCHLARDGTRRRVFLSAAFAAAAVLLSVRVCRADPYADLVQEAARRVDIPPALITAVLHAESAGDPTATSSKGAMGLMQLMPETWVTLRARLGLGADPYDPHDNIIAGATYLRMLHDRYGDVGFLAAYNAGPGRYDAHLASAPPLPVETQNYVASVAQMLDGAALPVAKTHPVSTLVVPDWTRGVLFVGHADLIADHAEPSMTFDTRLSPGVAKDGLFVPVSVTSAALVR